MTLINVNKHPNLAKAFNISKKIVKKAHVISLYALMIIGSLIGLNLLILSVLAPVLFVYLIAVKIKLTWISSKISKLKEPNNINKNNPSPINALNIEKKQLSKNFKKTLVLLLFFAFLVIPLIGPIIIIVCLELYKKTKNSPKVST